MKPSIVSTVFLASAFALQSPSVATAAPPALTTYGGVALSPDGRYVADLESVESADVARDAPEHLIVRDTMGTRVREIVLPCARLAACNVTLPVWAHDGKSIAYVVHAGKDNVRNVYVATISPRAIEAKKFLTFSGTLGSVRFSPDDARLAMLVVPNARKEVGATQAGAAIVGEIGTLPDEQRIATVSLAHPAVTFASPANLFVYEYDWVPGSFSFVGTAAPGDGDNNWWIARLYRFDGATARAIEVYRPSSAQQQLASPRVSPDGKQVAFIGGIMSDFGSTGGDLYTLALDDSHAAPLDMTASSAASVTSLAWMCDRDELLVTQLRGDQTQIAALSGRRSAPSSLPRTFESQAATLSSGDGANVSRSCEAPQPTIAATVQSYDRAPEIEVRGASGGWTPLTHENAGVPAEARAQSVAWLDDNYTVQGWLLEPPSAPTTAKRALVTIVHGGPGAANVPRFIGRGVARDLLRRGYAVFLPNPRGSFGQGETFTQANVRDFGYGDLRDILAGIDAVEKRDPSIDDARLGITGGSYGGFMTMWAVTQTNRFKAAVAGAGIADWMSYYGENGIDEWMIPFFGASAYDDPAVYRKSSPIEFIKNVRTPTFEYVGERDVECPAPQSLEFWHALVAQRVPTSLVIYPGEGHHIRSAANQADVSRRTLAWFDSYLKP